MAAKLTPDGALPFPASLHLTSLLFKDGLICVKPTTVINRIYAGLACASLGADLVSNSTVSWSDWGAILESVSLPTAPVNLLLWARTGDFQRVVPEGAYCQLCKLAVLSLKTHLLSCTVLLAFGCIRSAGCSAGSLPAGLVNQSVW